MKSDLNKAALDQGPQRKKWTKPLVRAVNIKETTQGNKSANIDGTSSNPRS